MCWLEIVKIMKILDFIGSSGDALFNIDILMLRGDYLSENNYLKIRIGIFYAGLPNRLPN